MIFSCPLMYEHRIHTHTGSPSTDTIMHLGLAE